ncbi:GntR family transcriptional regulator/MocR family aminotransferase [Pedobacter cryoconitis]|uniref:MocR-like pyridoxine biosynthesis transcription factor PdxR n=1 Tax=Pedobacter cryoconitis TaxID=188932 RepID=UPI00160986C5|nr:PLP-dependent aminotransferase family protein [Pedobacter cryoconitis]MBB6271046.1 GntR family transcriptional regulator/MocR family aminotransferase [Pedobacter cryoconitis]
MLRPWKTLFNISFRTDQTLVRQIADVIRKEIIKGRLERGASLPGSRSLAQDIGVNRKTVVFAYESLIAEGWLESRHKSGTFISENLPLIEEIPKRISKPLVSNFNYIHHHPFEVNDRPLDGNMIVFNEGGPDTRLAPLKELSMAYKRVFQRQGKWKLLGYGSEKGDRKLREMISVMLAQDRGLYTNPADIGITRGSQMAIYLAAKVLVRPGDVIAVENPGYYAVRKLFHEAGAVLKAVNADQDGINVDALEELCLQTKIKAVYVTPHHQYPTTVIMKAGRRIRLLELSLQYNFAVIEDDYDHEYHFGTGNNLALASGEKAANVIYISSLSKLIAPAIRVGYITGPKAFMESLINLRVQIDRQGDTILEHAIAELMEDGTMARHARKVVAIYKGRRDVMESCLRDNFGERISFRKPEGGLACWIKFNQKVNFNRYIELLRLKGVQIVPPGSFYLDNQPSDYIRLGYGSLNKEELIQGIKIMSEV